MGQILNILEHFDLKQLYKDDRAKFTNVIAEAMKAAFADRAHWLGDADFVRVPRGLIDTVVCKAIGPANRSGQTDARERLWVPPGLAESRLSGNTRHILRQPMQKGTGWRLPPP